MGTPFILLHGIPGLSQTWSTVAPLLAEYFDVIVPDLVGSPIHSPVDSRMRTSKRASTPPPRPSSP
ncbi:MAG TPA: alpha/beta fold hydrolase [Fibrobacteria bacterium]|nr:alpha/beta fold hydrolase [Fibrobacteria bacterium]